MSYSRTIILLTLILFATVLSGAAQFVYVAVHLPDGTAPLGGISRLTIVNRDGDRYVCHTDDAGIQELIGRGLEYSAMPESRESPGYPSWATIEARLKQWTEEFPDICRRYEIGKSVQGRTLWVMNISDNASTEETEPEFKYVANIHGDEKIGQDMVMRFIEHLLLNYAVDNFITTLVDHTDIHILPVMNPDGYVLGQRYNVAEKDLNRNFPSPFADTGPQQPETQAVIEWTAGRNFVLSSGLHSGAVGIVYPWGHEYDFNDPLKMFPETELMRTLCFTYTDLNPTMYGGDWEYGIINGAEWFTINGEMADWNYRFHGCLETTLEFSIDKAPPVDGLDAFWDGPDHNNRAAMIAYMAQVHRGVRGRITGADTGAPVSARVDPGIAGDQLVAVTRPALPEGWEMVSLPIDPIPNEPYSVFPDAIAVWGFSNRDGTYFEPDAIEGGCGYWAYHTAPSPAAVIVGMTLTDVPVPMAAGWHLVGPRGFGLVPDDPAVAPLVFMLANGRGHDVYGQLESDQEMVPFSAYWMQLFAATELFFGEPDSLNPPYPIFADRGPGPLLGDYYRLLLPGRHALRFASMPAGIAHQPPGAAALIAGEPVVIMAEVDPVYAGAQFFDIEVPDGLDGDQLPRHVDLDVSLQPLAVECRITWRALPDGDWQTDPLAPSDEAENIFAFELSEKDDGDTLEYFLALYRAIDDALIAVLPEPDGTFQLTFAEARSQPPIETVTDPGDLPPSSNQSVSPIRLYGSWFYSEEFMR